MPVLPDVSEGSTSHVAHHDTLHAFNNVWNGTTVYTPASFAPAVHNHTAAQITSGVITPARLGSGTPTSSNFLRGDGVWAAPVAPPTGFEGFVPADFALVSHTHGVNDLTATGTKSATTFLRGDNTWATPAAAVVLMSKDFYIDGAASAGLQKPKWRARGTWTIEEISADAGTAPSGVSLIFDVLLNGSSIWTAGQRLTMTAGTTASSTQTFTTSAVPDNGVFTLNVVQVGSPTAGSDVTVSVWLQLVSP